MSLYSEVVSHMTKPLVYIWRVAAAPCGEVTVWQRLLTVSRCFGTLRQLRQIRRSLCTCWLSGWFCHSLTLAVLCWSAFQSTWCAVCSQCWTRQHDSSIGWNAVTTLLTPWSVFIGYEYRSIFNTKSPCWQGCTQYSTANPRYLGPLGRVADLPGRRSLRSAACSATMECAAWDVVSALSLSKFCRRLKTFLFQQSHLNLVIWLYIWHHSGPWSDFSYLGHSKNYWTELNY